MDEGEQESFETGSKKMFFSSVLIKSIRVSHPQIIKVLAPFVFRAGARIEHYVAHS